MFIVIVEQYLWAKSWKIICTAVALLQLIPHITISHCRQQLWVVQPTCMENRAANI